MSDGRERLSILTLNIGNPSRERAERQLEWLQDRSEDVLVLTETAASRGCELLAERLSRANWQVRCPRPAEGERGVLIASRVRLAERGDEMLSYLPARMETATVSGSLVEVIGVYVPSRDGSMAKVERKRRFVTELTQAVRSRASRTVLVGDLNVLEPEHRPHYGWFQEWEYALYRDLLAAGWVDAYRLQQPSKMEHSWVGYEGDGYRYDHTFVSADLAHDVIACSYLHETRDGDLTDHSAMTLELKIAGCEPLAVDRAISDEQRTLF
jgi:exodeoxyribonuclease III